MFRSFQIIIREFRRSLLKLLHIHDLVRFCKEGNVAAYHVVWESVVESVIPRLTMTIRSGITFVSRNVISRRFL